MIIGDQHKRRNIDDQGWMLWISNFHERICMHALKLNNILYLFCILSFPVLCFYHYQYTNEELRRLCEFVRPLEAKGKEVYVFFNNLSMFEDALRFKRYLENKTFPSITGAVGLESVKRTMKRTRYPATKRVLLTRLGWRLVEVEGKQVRLNDLLKDMPSKAYGSVEEVLREVTL